MKLIRIPYRPDKNRDKNFADVYLFPDFKAWMKELGLEYNVDYTANYMSGKKRTSCTISRWKRISIFIHTASVRI